MDKFLYERSDLFRRGIRLSNNTLLKLERSGDFPPRIYLSPRRVVWPAEAIEDYMRRRVDEGAA